MASSMVAPRAFHFIEVDEARGILKKTSQNRDELLREIDYYRSLPKELQYLFPRIIDASIESEFPSVEIEYYGYPTLHSFFMSDDPNIFGDAIDSHNFDEDIFNAGDENLITAERENVYAGWKKIFERMKTAVDDMKKFPPDSNDSECKNAVREMYVEKVYRRFDRIRYDSNLPAPIKDRIAEIISKLPNLVDDLLLENAGECFHVIHGDMCLPNVMSECEFNFVRMIDPRGEFGTFKIHGDGRYDLAKLMHSIEGGYDFIIEDRFEVSSEEDQIDLKFDPAFENKTDSCVKIFSEVFNLNSNQMRQLRLIESTLFLSMIPLHNDAPRRQLAMAARGMDLFERVERS